MAPIEKAIDRARGHTGRRASGTMCRAVVRFDKAMLVRIDALIPHFDGSSRASLIRAFCVVGLGLAEEHVKALPPPTEGSAL